MLSLNPLHLYRRVRSLMSTMSPSLKPHRDAGKQAAIVFIHGFGGDIAKTWGRFVEFVGEEDRLKGWDLFSLGYPTGLFFDLSGIWSADPPLITVSDRLSTSASLPPLDRYQSLALVAHSMGGLVVQRALLDYPKLAGRVSHVFLFGTPSAGLTKASPFHFWKRQIADMTDDCEFIRDLRARWVTQFGARRPFQFWAIAGERDEFVPRISSVDPFPPQHRAVVPGNHLEIVKPGAKTDLNVQLVIKGLVGEAAPAGPWNSANVAVESRQFEEAIAILEPNAAKLDDPALVSLALALEGTGQKDKALKVLQEHGRQRKYTDAMGVLAGRLKRQWMVERIKSDADEALALYSEAYTLAAAANDHPQAFYNGINVAFLSLAYLRDNSQAQAVARQVLSHAEKSPADKWRLATEGEANLILGNTEDGLKKYLAALQLQPPPSPREVQSMFQQAMWIATFKSDERVGARLKKVFHENTL